MRIETKIILKDKEIEIKLARYSESCLFSSEKISVQMLVGREDPTITAILSSPVKPKRDEKTIRAKALQK